MSSGHGGGAPVEEARAILCRELSRILEAGRFTIRTRILMASDRPVEAHFYSHREEGWHKEPYAVTEPEVVRALHESVELLFSKGHGDEWSATRHATADHLDVDLHFHREKLENRTGKKLESAVAGLLFRDSHDSKKDVRRSIRTRR